MVLNTDGLEKQALAVWPGLMAHWIELEARIRTSRLSGAERVLQMRPCRTERMTKSSRAVAAGESYCTESSWRMALLVALRVAPRLTGV